MQEVLEYLSKVTLGFLRPEYAQFHKAAAFSAFSLSYAFRCPMDIFINDANIGSMIADSFHMYYIEEDNAGAYATIGGFHVHTTVASRLIAANGTGAEIQLVTNGLPALIGCLGPKRNTVFPLFEADLHWASFYFGTYWDELQDPKLRLIVDNAFNSVARREITNARST